MNSRLLVLFVKKNEFYNFQNDLPKKMLWLKHKG